MTTLAGITRADWGERLKESYRHGHIGWVIAATAAVYVAGMATRALLRRLRQQPLFWLLRAPSSSLAFGVDPGNDDGSLANRYVLLSTPWTSPDPLSSCRFPAADFLAAGGMAEEDIQRLLGEPRQPEPYQVAAIDSIERGRSGGISIGYNPKPTYPPSDRSGQRQRQARGFKSS